MADRTKATATTAGVLRPDQLRRHASIERTSAHPDLDRFVENHWTLRWRLPDGTRHESSTLPHPACTVSVELGHPRAGVGDDRVVVTGVVTRRFDVDLHGAGFVHGVKLRPGGLAALTGVDARTLTDRTVPAAGLLPPAAVSALRALTDDLDAETAARLADEALLPLVPTDPDPGYDLVLRVVGDMLSDRSLLRAAQVEERHGVSGRRLQRLFSRYVGVGPKWLLARYRMHDVVSALDAGHDGTLADLAAAHGWYDQAHFARDFTALVGVPPSHYRAHRDGPDPTDSRRTGNAQTTRRG